MIKIGKHKFYVVKNSRLFDHSVSCGCGQIMVDTPSWRTVLDIEELYVANSMGLNLDEFAIKMGLASPVRDDHI